MSTRPTAAATAEIVELMRQLVRSARRGDAAQLSGLPVTPAQARVLQVVKQTYGPLRVSELADQLGILPRSATSVVDDLEQLGLVQRSPDRRDRRAVLVSLTFSGRSLADSLDACDSGAVASAILQLSAADQEALTRILQQLVTMSATMRDPR